MRVLLVGASGFVGGVLHRALRLRHGVVGTTFTRPRPGLRQVDVGDAGQLDRLLGETFDVIVYAAAFADGPGAESDPARAWRINVDAPARITGSAAARIVYLSSDNVFRGDAPPYFESSPRCPANEYGRSKAAGEDAVLDDPRNLVLRLPMLYGLSPTSDRFTRRFGQPIIDADPRTYANPLYLGDLVDAMDAWLYERGVLHFGGPEVLSRYEILSRAAAQLFPAVRVRPAADPTLRRPAQPILATTRIVMPTRPLDMALREMRTELERRGSAASTTGSHMA